MNSLNKYILKNTLDEYIKWTHYVDTFKEYIKWILLNKYFLKNIFK